jgi:hypothetical protein
MKPGDKIIKIERPFYGLFPFKLGMKWHWGKKIKVTYLVNTDMQKCPIKTELYEPLKF